MALKYPYRITMLCLQFLGILFTSLEFFGASPLILRTANAVLKIDTTKASLNDVMGGFKVHSSINRNESHELFEYHFDDKSFHYSFLYTLNPYEEVLRFQNFLNSTIEAVMNDPKVDDFKIPRVFGVNDKMVMGSYGFHCYSAGKMMRLGGKTLCPANSLMSCFGETTLSSRQVRAYKEIDIDYMKSNTNLDHGIIDELGKNYTNVRKYFRQETLRLNLPMFRQKPFDRMFCKTWYINRLLLFNLFNFCFLISSFLLCLISSSTFVLSFIAFFIGFLLKNVGSIIIARDVWKVVAASKYSGTGISVKSDPSPMMILERVASSSTFLWYLILFMCCRDGELRIPWFIRDLWYKQYPITTIHKDEQFELETLGVCP